MNDLLLKKSRKIFKKQKGQKKSRKTFKKQNFSAKSRRGGSTGSKLYVMKVLYLYSKELVLLL
jgi:hypothetical protein